MLEAVASLSLTTLDLGPCNNITDAGIGALQRLALTTLELIFCDQATDDGINSITDVGLSALRGTGHLIGCDALIASQHILGFALNLEQLPNFATYVWSTNRGHHNLFCAFFVM